VFTPSRAFPALSNVLSKAKSLPQRGVLRVTPLGKAPALLANNKLGWKGSPGTNTLLSGKLWPYSQTLNLATKLARDKHSSLFRSFVNYVRKKFYKSARCVAAAASAPRSSSAPAPSAGRVAAPNVASRNRHSDTTFKNSKILNRYDKRVIYSKTFIWNKNKS